MSKNMNMIKRILSIKIIFILVVFPLTVFGQFYSVKGIIKDSSDNNPCIGANVILTKIITDEKTRFTTSDNSGSFSFTNVEPGRYVIQITFIGYVKFIDTIRVGRRDLNLGEILMTKTPVTLEQVEIIGNIIQAEQKEDTIQYLAKGFKVNKDAVAEDLLTKIPGVLREDGKIKTQGEEVKQILVDGKPFFGEDPDIALKNMPAELIEKIQIYDRMSDQAQFTGFDDGQTTKAINIITREDRQTSQFGKLYGGVGTTERYLSGGNINLFNRSRRISLIGMVNNINQQNFSSQDLLGISGSRGDRQFRGGSFRASGFAGRGGWGGASENFLVGGQEGNTNTYSLGLNYFNSWGDNLNISGSYFLNHTKNLNDQKINRDYYSDPLNQQFYSETSNSTSKNYNHRINLRAEYIIDTLNSIIITPKLYFQNNTSLNNLFGSNYFNTLLNSSTNNVNDAENTGYNLSNELLIRHKFDLPGRTISLNLNTGVNSKNTERALYSFNEYFNNNQISEETIDQELKQLTDGYNLFSNLVYTEPLWENSQIQMNISGNFSKNRSDKKTNAFNSITNLYDELDSLQSNEFENKYSTVRGGISYRIRTDEINFSAGINYQNSYLKGEQIFPSSNLVSKKFDAVLPNARFSYKLSESSNLRINYFANTNPPSINQLQNTLDNTNSLFLSTGNPNLREEFSHRLSARYLSTNLNTGASFFAMIFFNYINNDIGKLTINALKDTLLSSGIFLRKGEQLTYPVNYDYSYSIRSFMNAGFPINVISCNLNLNTSLNFSLTPGQINEILNFSKTYSISQGLMINSNISQDIDFRVSYYPSYNISKNDKQTELSRDYFIHNASASVYWLFLDRLFVKGDFTYYFNQGISADLNREYFLLNASAGIKLFENRNGELRFDAFDIFDQNRSLNKVINEFYVEEKSVIVLRRYYMLSFVYNLRLFGN